MFTLKYKITNDDMKRINTRIMRMYFALYFTVSLLGLGAGIAATIMRPRTEILVFGIILIVLGANTRSVAGQLGYLLPNGRSA